MGVDKLVDPSRLRHIFVSPRKRARKTFEVLLPPSSSTAAECEKSVTYTEDIAEWAYGKYEGLKVEEIRKLRKGEGLDRDREWDIWRDGCEGGEYVVINFHPFLELVVIDGPLLIASYFLLTLQPTDLCSKSASV